jgi:hypothetical protein
MRTGRNGLVTPPAAPNGDAPSCRDGIRQPRLIDTVQLCCEQRGSEPRTGWGAKEVLDEAQPRVWLPVEARQHLRLIVVVMHPNAALRETGHVSRDDESIEQGTCVDLDELVTGREAREDDRRSIQQCLCVTNRLPTRSGHAAEEVGIECSVRVPGEIHGEDAATG